MEHAELAAVMRKATVGDEVEVSFRMSSSSPPVTRRVTVIGRDDNHLYTTSGRVRPGHFTGGCITEYAHGIYYSPTMQQQTRAVLALKISR